MPKPNYSHWLTKQQAAAAIGCSTKTVEQLAKMKQLHQVTWQRPETGAHVRMYHPDDANRIRKERNPDAEPFAVPIQAPAEQTAALTVPTSAEQFFRALVAAAGGSENSAKHSENRSQVRLAEKLYLTIPEASDYAGLPKSHLRKLMAEGKLEALKTGAGWRIRRGDLEKL